jgi:acyl-CoA synthetase (AMP-forming)/AMP-acid ligase II
MVFERALELLGSRISALYGMTEAPVTSYLPPAALDAPLEQRRTLIESVGQELFSCEVRLAATDGGAETSDQSGEVLIRGPHVMAGYLGNEALTLATLRDGWLHTGDIGRRDAAGNLHIIGRLHDVIRTGSSSVVPKEVEDVIALHPAVDEVAVIGLPDTEWGEAVTAFVVLRAGMAASEHDLVEHCRAHLAGFKKPRSVRFVPSLPRSHYGKVIKSELLAMSG